MKTPEDAPAPPLRTPASREQIIRSFIGQLRADTPGDPPRIGRGNLAALRRMDPDAYDVPAFWQLLAQATGGDMVSSEDMTMRWALVAHGMALMAPDWLNRVEIGEALHAIHYAEGRLARLLGSRGPQFRALVPRLCRHLAAKRQPIDWFVFAELILTESRNEEVAERIRRRIASHYYGAQAKADAATA